jgi:ABC-type dipeptide/oligopeptide/nickel transport system ATPase component
MLDRLYERHLKIKTLRENNISRISELTTEVADLEAELDIRQQSNAILDILAEQEVEEGVKTYVHLLDEGLKAIFPEQEIQQDAEIIKTRGKVSVRLKTIVVGKDGIKVEGEGLDTFGGAVSTIQSLLLRVSLILKRNLRPLLILDETFPAVDEARIELLVDFLKALCAKLDMDILCITHQPALAENADLAYRVSPSKNGAVFTKIT